MANLTIYRDAQGFASSIDRDGVVVLHLNAGTSRNEANVEAFVARLNALEAVEKAAIALRDYERDGAPENWNRWDEVHESLTAALRRLEASRG